MFYVYDMSFFPIARDLFLDELDIIFAGMIEGIKKLVDTNREELGGLKWLTMCHDMWNTITMDGALGSSLMLTTKDMKTYTIDDILEKNDVSHAMADVAEKNYKTYDLRYGINLKTEAASVQVILTRLQ